MTVNRSDLGLVLGYAQGWRLQSAEVERARLNLEKTFRRTL